MHASRTPWTHVAVRVAAVLLIGAAAAGAARAQDSGRIGTLVDRVRMPLATELFLAFMQELRTSAPDHFLTGVGRSAKLGEQWKRANPHYDRARQAVASAFAAGEQRGGPLFGLTLDRFKAAFRPPWTDDDLRFLLAFIETPDGRLFVELQDAGFVRGFHQALRKDVNASPEFRAYADRMLATARERFAALTPRLAAARKQSPKDYDRAVALVQRLDEKLAESTIALALQDTQQRIGGIAFDVIEDLKEPIEAFRRENGLR